MVFVFYGVVELLSGIEQSDESIGDTDNYSRYYLPCLLIVSVNLQHHREFLDI